MKFYVMGGMYKEFNVTRGMWRYVESCVTRGMW